MLAEHTISQAEVQLTANRPIRAAAMRVRAEVRPHDHDYSEVCFITSGRGFHQTSNYRRPLSRGDILVVAPREVHALVPVSSLSVINVYYLSEWLLREVNEFWDRGTAFSLFFSHALFRFPRGFPIPHFSTKGSLADACERELLDLASGNDPLYLRGAFVKFMVLSTSLPVENTFSHSIREDVWSAIQRIEQALASGASFEPNKIASGASVSFGHLARLFKQQTGWTPSDYFQYRRLQKACVALLDRQNSITQVALEAGYADASHFGRHFRRFFNLSPREYRQFYRV